MPLFSREERTRARAVGALSYANPFLPARIELEKQVLGDVFVPLQHTWSADPDQLDDNSNVMGIREHAARLSESARRAIIEGRKPVGDELRIYEDLVLYELYYRYENRLYREITQPRSVRQGQAVFSFYKSFEKDVAFFFNLPNLGPVEGAEPAHLFSMFYQHRRAFHFIFRRIFGGSMAVSRLRAAVWESVFTGDPRRYRRAFADRMHDFSTLITGPSGTGKELVAGAIGLSRHIPFDKGAMRFVEDFDASFHPLNLSALAPTLLESELFGHKKGAFTGAALDKEGYLEGKSASHTVFLDEIGDVDTSIQLKLLRVLQTRTFQAIGDPTPRHFGGKIVAATNRNLSKAIQEGAFRADLYYRLCSDHIVTPSLREQISGVEDELHRLVCIISRRVVGKEACETVSEEVTEWILAHLGKDYRWPGNIRELEQCIRNIVVHGEYRPLEKRPPQDPVLGLADDFVAGSMTADEMLSKYYTLIYHQTGQYVETARRLDVDRRTVKGRIDRELMEKLSEG